MKSASIPNTSKAAGTARNNSGGIIAPTLIAAALLVAPAVAAWITGWRWQLDGGGAWMRAALLVTNTAGFPYAAGTSFALAAAIAWLLRKKISSWRRLAGLGALCLAAILFGQAVKSLVKNAVGEPRPYVVRAANERAFSPDAFYALKRGERAALLGRSMGGDARVPPALLAHWKRDTGFAFPSGHTSFAATWALLGVAFLWRAGIAGRVFCGAAVAWAGCVGATRLALGMHWPGDIAAGVLLSWAIVAGLVAIWQKFVMRGASGTAA